MSNWTAEIVEAFFHGGTRTPQTDSSGDEVARIKAQLVTSENCNIELRFENARLVRKIFDLEKASNA